MAKEKTVQFSVRLPESIVIKIDRMAEKQVRTRTNLVEFMLREYIRLTEGWD